MTDTIKALQKAFDDLRFVERMCLVDPPHPAKELDVGYRIGLVRKDLEAALAAPQPTIPSDQDVIENLMTALQWYANGEHFCKCDPNAWDTVSGEPQNWWCDEAGTATIEDGSLAKMVLSGEITGAQLQAMEDGEVFEQTPEPQPVKQAEPGCSDHPDAPHGFSRNASHNAGRYVCDCEGWTP